MTGKGPGSLTVALGRFRGAFYLFLSRAFSRELDRDILEGMEQVSATLMEAWEPMNMPSDSDVQAGKTLLKEFFTGFRQHPDGMIRDLAAEYASLFLGMGPKTVSPCESVYRSGSGLLYQSSLFEVRRLYNGIGMAKNDQYHEPDDHIAVELMYMATLCEMTGETLKSDKKRSLHYLSLQQEFLKTHLAPWVPVFSQKLMAAAGSAFYRAVAHLARGYIGIDPGLVEMLVRELGPGAASERDKAGRN